MKKRRKIIPDKTAPILVIVFALAMLIGGGYYVWAFSSGTAPNIPTIEADPWANNVNRGVAAGEPLTAKKWNGLVNRVASLSGGGVATIEKIISCEFFINGVDFGGDSENCYPRVICDNGFDLLLGRYHMGTDGNWHECFAYMEGDIAKRDNLLLGIDRKITAGEEQCSTTVGNRCAYAYIGNNNVRLPVIPNSTVDNNTALAPWHTGTYFYIAKYRF